MSRPIRSIFKTKIHEWRDESVAQKYRQHLPDIWAQRSDCLFNSARPTLLLWHSQRTWLKLLYFSHLIVIFRFLFILSYFSSTFFIGEQTNSQSFIIASYEPRFFVMDCHAYSCISSRSLSSNSEHGKRWNTTEHVQTMDTLVRYGTRRLNDDV